MTVKPTPATVVPHGTDTAALLPNGWRVTPAGRAVPLRGDMPLAMAVTPDRKFLITVTGGFHDEDVVVMNLATGAITQSLDVDKAWAGLCFDPSGKTLYVAAGAGANQEELIDAIAHSSPPARVASLGQTVLRFGFAGGKVTPAGNISVPDVQNKDRWTAGLAMGRDGALYVAETQEDAVYKINGPSLAVETKASVGYRPYACALSPDGRTLAVSNWGGASVSLVDPATMKERVRVAVGSHPNQLVWGKDGRLYVACSGSNSVSVIARDQVVETVKTSLRPDDPVGSTPDALALSPTGRTLYVANADNNDVAVLDVSDPKESIVRGFIPTGWYPSALAVSPDGKRLFVGTGKGLHFRANAVADNPFTRSDPYADGRKYDYVGGLLHGTISIVPVPDGARLAAYTRQVRADVPSPPLPTPNRAVILAGAFHKIKHVVYIIRENRTYDEVFGDIKAGNGDPNLVLFGQQVTPNAHALAANYVLLDNLYCNGEVSEDGHQWCDAAYATDFTERAYVDSYSDRGEPDADDRLTASPAGYLWDNCRRHGVSYFSYGEQADFKSSPSAPPVFQGNRGLVGHASADYAKYDWFAGPRDVGRADVFIRDLHAAEKTGRWPQFMVMSLPEDHTQGLSAGGFTPAADVGENDQALGKIVQAVSHSAYWKSTAIFVIEDDAQNGPDHVDAHRTVGLVISPYVRRGADHTMYTTASFVRTMELMLGLPPMTQFDKDATPLYNSFAPQPRLAAYSLLPPGVDLEARNPKTGPGAAASALLDFSAPDRADPDALNAILWRALKPGRPLPAPVRSARLAP